MDRLKKSITWLKNFNKIYLLMGGIAVYMLFFDRNSAWEGYLLNQRVMELERNIAIEEEKIKENEERLSKVLEDNEALERFAREKYLMHREDEDLFILETE